MTNGSFLSILRVINQHRHNDSVKLRKRIVLESEGLYIPMLNFG